jgi:hypothetical protein
MTDTDIKALVEWLRKRDAQVSGPMFGTVADALEALQAEIMDLRGLLAETVPDPEYRKMQDDEIERLREERLAWKHRAEKAEAEIKELRRLLVIADE